MPRDIITCPSLRITRIGEVLHQMGLRARALTGRPRTLRRRLPRLLVHLAAADQRPARRADGGAQQGADAVLRGDGDARIGRRLLRALSASPNAAGKRSSQATEGGAHGARAGALPAPRRAGADGARDSAAARALQAVRADGGCRRSAPAAVRRVDCRRARAPLPCAWRARDAVRRRGARADADARPRGGDLGRGLIVAAACRLVAVQAIDRVLDPEISIVIPLRDEEQNVVPLHDELADVLDQIGRPVRDDPRRRRQHGRDVQRAARRCRRATRR